MEVLGFFGILLAIFVFVVLPIVAVVNLAKTRSDIKHALTEFRGLMDGFSKHIAGLPQDVRRLSRRIDHLQATLEGKPVSTVPSADEEPTAEKVPAEEVTAEPQPESPEQTPEPEPAPEPPSVPEPEVVKATPPVPVAAMKEPPSKDEAPAEKPVEEKPEAVAVQQNVEQVASEPVAGAQRQKTVSDGVDAVLQKMWRRFLVGEDPEKRGMSREAAIFSTWLMRVGFVFVAFAGWFFLDVVHRMLPPEGKVALVAAIGVGLLVAGVKIATTRYRILGLGGMGVGFAFLYASLYSAGPQFEVLPIPIAFALMILVTVAAGILAVRLDSQTVAVFGIIGGYMTPILLSTGVPQFLVLYSYMLLLTIGILAISHVKQWRWLNYLGFLFTYVLYFLSLDGYESGTDFPVAIVFLTLLFIVHSALVYYYNVMKGGLSNVLDIIHLVLNVSLYAGASFYLINDAFGRPWPALMAVGVAVFYIAHVYGFLRRGIKDRSLLTAFLGIAGFFVVWAMPLAFEKDTLTIFWSLQALLFMWLGYKMNSTALRAIGNVVFVIVFYRVLVWDLPRNFDELNWSDRAMVDYLKSLLDRAMTFGTVIVSLFGAFWIQHAELKRSKRLAVSRDNDVPTPPEQARSVAQQIVYWAGVGLLFLVSYLELTQLFSYYTPLQAPILTALWCGLAVFLLVQDRKHSHRVLFLFAGIAVAIGVLKLLFGDMTLWEFELERMAYSGDGIGVLMRFLDYGVVFAILLLFYRLVGRQSDIKVFQNMFRVAAISLLFLYTTLEVNTVCRYHLAEFQAGAISILWTVFAVAFLARGLRRDSKRYRYSGLVLFGIVAVKVLIWDLADLEFIWRVMAFMVVGGLMVGGSYAYLKAGVGGPKDDKGDDDAAETIAAGADGGGDGAADSGAGH